MRVHLVTIGDEILLGRTLNTNGAYIGRRLAEIGIAVEEQSTIRDDPDVLETFLRKAIEESDVVITTGGLGPTGDDNTKDVLARIFGRKIRRDKRILRYLEKHYERKLCRLVKTQADVPVDTIIIPNNVGTSYLTSRNCAGGEQLISRGVIAQSVSANPRSKAKSRSLSRESRASSSAFRPTRFRSI